MTLKVKTEQTNEEKYVRNKCIENCKVNNQEPKSTLEWKLHCILMFVAVALSLFYEWL